MGIKAHIFRTVAITAASGVVSLALGIGVSIYLGGLMAALAEKVMLK